MPGLTGTEARRKLVHVAVGGFAFLLRYLTWPQAVAYGRGRLRLQPLPAAAHRRPRALARDERRGFPLGILLYPLAVLALVLVFRHDLWMAAAVWGVLAFGDGMATLVGLAAGGPRLPWNPARAGPGPLAFVVCGTIGRRGARGLDAAAAARARPAARGSSALALPLALVCALVESVPTTLDDNLTVPLAGALVLPLLAQADPRGLAPIPDLRARVLIGLAVNGAIAGDRRAGRMDGPVGRVSAVRHRRGHHRRPRPARPRGDGGLLRDRHRGHEARVPREGRARHRAGEGRGARLAQRLGQRRRARVPGAAGGGRRAAAGARPALLLAVAYAAAVATAAADTCSSEVGKAYGRRTFLITTLRPVPPGTEGAVSLEGTLGGLAGGALVGAVGAAVGLYAGRWPWSWPRPACSGSLAESVMGTVAERRGWMGNDLLNAFNTAAGAGIAMGMAGAGMLGTTG